MNREISLDVQHPHTLRKRVGMGRGASSLCALICLGWVLTLAGCETTARPEEPEAGEMAGASAGEAAGQPAGESAGESAGDTAGDPAGESAGDPAGESAGDPAGEAAGDSAGDPGGIIIEAGDSAGEMSGTPTFDPTAPLPEPQATTLMPPAQIGEPSDDQLDPACEGAYVSEVRGWITDEVGEPMAGAKIQICIRVYETGMLLCLQPKDTVSGGYFSVNVPETSRCMSEMATRALVPRVAFAPIYCHADLEGERSDAVLRLNDPLVLYQTRPTMRFDDLGDTSAPHTVDLPGDVTLTLTPDDLYGPTIDTLGGRALSPDAPGLCFLGEAEGPAFDGVYAFAPEGDLTGSTATLRFPNDAGYDPGADVELYVLGNLDCSVEGMSEPLEESSWTRQGRATVDASGEWIESAADGGLPCLSWFGYRLAQ